jgi:hypothetical protein
MLRERALRGLVAGLSFGALAAVGCAAAPAGEDADHPHDEEPKGMTDALSSGTVLEAADGSCTTTSVKGLSLQIIQEANCVAPGASSLVPQTGKVSFGAAVFPYLEKPARDKLVMALEAYPSTTMTINSMFRSVAQQYLLYRWYQRGQCGVGLAAEPGYSNHETGLALDVSEYSTWKGKLSSYGFSWLGSGDPVHFDYVGAGAVDHRGLDVRAFQRLWNLNNPNDEIAEDGSYGPATEGRLKKSPASGFPIASSCGAVACDATFKDICGSPHEDDIEWLAAAGLTSGCDPVQRLYCPNALVTRGQVAQFLAAALHLSAGPDAFVDDEGSPYEAAIDAIAKAGITSGCDANGPKYCPDDPVSRAQMAAFLAAAFDLPAGPDAFVDDDGSPHEAAINAIAKAGITSGCDAANGRFCPDTAVTRAQMATFLHRALDLH